MYCAYNLLKPNIFMNATNGEARMDMKSGPRNVLGTTPGNS
jgi:hypothetical protein